MVTPTQAAAYTTVRRDVLALVPESARTILDVGCANGALGAELKKRSMVPSVWGLEGDSELADEAARRLDHVLHCDLEREGWESWLAGKSFDCIICADVLEHLRSPDTCLAALRELLADEGVIIVSLPNIRHLSALYSIFIAGTFPVRQRGIFDQTHLRWFTFADAAALFKRHGLQIQATDYALRWGDAGGGQFNRILNKLPRWLRYTKPVREFLSYQTCFLLRESQ